MSSRNVPTSLTSSLPLAHPNGERPSDSGQLGTDAPRKQPASHWLMCFTFRPGTKAEEAGGKFSHWISEVVETSRLSEKKGSF